MHWLQLYAPARAQCVLESNGMPGPEYLFNVIVTVAIVSVKLTNFVINIV